MKLYPCAMILAIAVVAPLSACGQEGLAASGVSARGYRTGQYDQQPRAADAVRGWRDAEAAVAAAWPRGRQGGRCRGRVNQPVQPRRDGRRCGAVRQGVRARGTRRGHAGIRAYVDLTPHGAL
jgi:hypothetical protein